MVNFWFASTRLSNRFSCGDILKSDGTGEEGLFFDAIVPSIVADGGLQLSITQFIYREKQMNFSLKTDTSHKFIGGKKLILRLITITFAFIKD